LAVGTAGSSAGTWPGGGAATHLGGCHPAGEAGHPVPPQRLERIGAQPPHPQV